MKRFSKTVLSLLVALCFMLSSVAFADVQRGDSGDEVINLQTLLFECGWLFETPDGSFGRNTEQAVKDYQEYAGFDVTGIATDEMVAQLQEDWYMLHYGALPEGYIEGETDGGSDFALTGNYPYFCNRWNQQNGNSEIDYCETHMNLHMESQRLMANGDAASAQQACDLWRIEIVQLYDKWAELVEEEDRPLIVAARAQYLVSVETQRKALSEFYNSFQTHPGEAAVDYVTETLLREHAAWLCAVLSGMAE